MDQVQLNNEVKKRVKGGMHCSWCGGVISGKAVRRMKDGLIFHDEECAFGYYEDKFQNSILDDNLFYFGHIWEYHLDEFQRANILRDLEVIEVIHD